MKVQIKRRRTDVRHVHNGKPKTVREKTREDKPHSWQRSEAVWHLPGSTQLQEKTTGLYDKENEKHSGEKMREAFRAENSFGNVAVGVNYKKEASVVFSKKREHDAPAATEHEKSVHMERKKRERTTGGHFYMNPDIKQDGAVAFYGKTALPEARLLTGLHKFYKKSGSRMMEQQMPYLQLGHEKKKLHRLEEKRRESSEQVAALHTSYFDGHIKQTRENIYKLEQQEKQMQLKLKEAWRKVKKVPTEGDIRRPELLSAEPLQDKTSETAPEQPKPEDTDEKNVGKNRNDYKNVESHSI